MRLFLAIVLCCTISQLSAQKVLIIGIDGCRADAVKPNAPNINDLLNEAVYSFDALTEAPTVSGVGWSSMLTGVWGAKHGVYDNSFTGSNYDVYPHFYKHLEEFNPALRTSSICHWTPINDNILISADYILDAPSDLAVTEAAIEELSNQDPDVLFLQYDDVDHAGHSFGFSPTILEYNQAVAVTDAYIGQVLQALHQRPNYDAENWMILLSTDHGGTLSGHGGTTCEERNIFLIAHQDNLPHTEIKRTETVLTMGTAISLNGTDQYIQPIDQSPFQFALDQDFTVELLVRYDALSGDAAFISDKDWASGANKGWVISTPFGDQSRWKVNIGDGSNRADLEGGTINDGNWHRLSVTFDRDALMTLYQDGELLGSITMASVGEIISGLHLTIGQDGTLEYPFWFSGNIADVRIWKGVLSPESIKQFACSVVDDSHPAFADLLANWKMEEGTGTLFADAVNGNNANMTGSSPEWENNFGTLTCIDYSNTPRITDLAVTAMTHLCIPIDPNWNLDGKSLVSVCEPNDISNLHATIQLFTIAPNPAREQAIITFNHDIDGQLKQIRAFDAVGRMLLQNSTSDDQYNLMLQGYRSGVVRIEISSSGKSSNQALVITP